MTVTPDLWKPGKTTAPNGSVAEIAVVSGIRWSGGNLGEDFAKIAEWAQVARMI